MEPVTYLKLGGSLITDKKIPHTARLEIMERAAGEIKYALDQSRVGKLIIGHGSGSFGHVPGQKYHTREGVHTPEQWMGFIEVWSEARELNQIMVKTLIHAGLPVMAFPPSAMFTTENGHIKSFKPEPILLAVESGIIPLVFGDVALDTAQGGTILSTEDVFAELINHIPPTRVLLAGVDKGVFSDFPECTKLIKKLGIHDVDDLSKIAGGSDATDVTGGMLEKLRILIHIIEQVSDCQGLIFSGMETGNIERALLGENPGTLVVSN